MSDDRVFRGSSYRNLAEASLRLAEAADEPALEPALPIVDPHHHLQAAYPPENFLADLAGGHDVRQTVFIDSGANYRADGPKHLRAVGETTFAAGVGRAHPGLCAGIVAHAALDQGDRVQDALDRHAEAADGRLRGVRDLVQWDAEVGRFSSRKSPPHRLADPRFREGFARLAPMRLSFDVWVFHPQLAEVAALADAFPGTRIILDHLGGPLGVGPYAENRAEAFADWRDGLSEIARRDNVWLKLGGLGMPYAGFDLHFPQEPPTSEAVAAAWRPHVETAIGLFGPARCMFESNFPADKQTCSYAVLWNAFKRLSAGYGDSEREALFSDAARNAYRLA